MQKVYDEWELIGIVAKIAPKNKMVTNRHSGGHGILLDKLFRKKNISELKYKEIRGLLYAIGHLGARDLSNKFIGLRELGFDIAIDDNLNLSILEVNTKPQFGIFKQLKDQTMFTLINENNKKILDSVSYIKREL